MDAHGNSNGNEQETEMADVSSVPYGTKSFVVALLLCIFFGVFGVHRFYVGKIGTGLLYLVTIGFLGIGVIVDLITIITGSFSDKQGYRLRR